MKRNILILMVILMAGALLVLLGAGCAEQNKESEAGVHPEGWADPGSANFHGPQGQTTANCTPCHGADLQGGQSGVSCVACHNAFQHSTGWANPSQHGQTVVAENFNLAACAICHLTTTNGDSSWSCWTCHSYYPHKASINPDNPNGFQHGGAVIGADYQVWLCKTCHGNDYSGGDAGVARLTLPCRHPGSL